MSYSIYTLILFVSIYLLNKSWDRNKLDAFSGFLFGGIFFFIIPALLTIILGPIEAEGLNIDFFDGTRIDISIFSFSIFLPLIFFQFLALKSAPSYIYHPEISRFTLTLALSIVTLLLVFKISGKTEGKHWADAASTKGVIPNIISITYLTLRTYIFSLASILIPKNKKIIVYIFAFSVMDIILTGNRISLLYFVLAILLSRTLSTKKIFIVGAVLSPPIILFTAIYPAIRGVLWSEFGGLQGIKSAAIYSFDNFDFKNIGASIVWNLFEAANLAVFQYIFDHFGSGTEFINGQTVLIKPLSLFIPREIWENKPEGLGIRLGDMIAGVPGLSLNSLMLGEFWANFGWLSSSLLFIILLLTLFSLYTIKRASRDIDLSRFIFFIAFASWRHEFNYFIFSIIIGVFIIRLLSTTETLVKRKFSL